MQVERIESNQSVGNFEFTLFSIFIFIAKSFLLIRMPYRGVELNSIYTLIILASFYFYLRIRQSIISPPVLLFFLAGAIGADVVGNYLQLYGKHFGPVMYDEFTHFLGPALSLPATMWALRESLKKAEITIPYNLLSLFSASLTFAFAAYYEILELWDEKFFGGKRLWTPTDSANDLQFGLLGIIISTFITVSVFKIIDKQNLQNNKQDNRGSYS